MIKNCRYCTKPFDAKTSEKYCEEHRNKICKKCGCLKESMKEKASRNNCNKCELERSKNYYKRKKELDPNWKPYYSKEKKRLERKLYCLNNKDKIKKYYQDNKSELCKRQSVRYQMNKENILARNKKWQMENKEHFNILNKKSTDKFRKNNPHIVAWRNILHRTLRYLEVKKNKKTFELCGYSGVELRLHIESLFTEGMTWDNYGEWHIDHIIPVTRFPKDTHVSVVNALSNLQPLWRLDNLRKKNN